MSDINWSRDVTRESGSTSIIEWKKEIAGCYEKMVNFIDTDALTVFQNLSQFSARASEIRSRISSNASREETTFRTRVLDPFLEECDRQFKLHSRIQAINELDARLAGGKFA